MLKLLLRLIGILLLAALVSGAWLYRDQLVQRFQSSWSSRATEAAQDGGPATAGALGRARDKVDSLNGWHADSILLNPPEMAALIMDGLPAEVGRHLDSLALSLGDGSVTVRARVETAQIPKEALGLLAGALNPWEPIEAAGPVANAKPGQAYWQVDHLTLRGFALPQAMAHELIARTFHGSREGQLPFRLPDGVAGLRVRAEGVALYPTVRR
jgi:hypothetical protein